MKPTRWLALSAAVAGCAVAYGFHLFGKPEGVRPVAAVLAGSETAAGLRGGSVFEPAGDPARAKRARPAAGNGAAHDGLPTSSARGEIQVRKVGGVPAGTDGNLLSEARWRENAAKVEAEANHELTRLSALLDLDPVQEDKMFSALAQQSRYWLPGMQAGGTVPGSSSDVTASLTSDQERALVQEEMDRQAWWAEVLPQLLPPAFQEGGAGETISTAGAAAGAEAPPDTKTFDGESGLTGE